MEYIITIVIIAFFVIVGLRILIELFFDKAKPKRRRRRRKTTKRRSATKLSKKERDKADKKYTMLLRKFKRSHKRKPTRSQLGRVVIAASHHVFPVKGRNSRRSMRGTRGHWRRQAVRKYLFEKHNIQKNYKMK